MDRERNGQRIEGYDGFKWINPDDADNSVFSFIRKKPDTYNDSLVFVCNFTPIERGEYVIGVPNPGDYVVELSTDDVYGVNRATYTAQKMPEGEQIFGFDYKLTVDLKGFESIIMRTPELKIRKPIRRTVKKKKK